MHNYIIDKALLLIASVCIAIYSVGPSFSVVIALLISISLFGLAYYYDDERITFAIFISFLILCLILSTFCYYIPLIAYQLWLTKYNERLLLYGIPILIHLDVISATPLFLIILSICLTILLATRNQKLSKTEVMFHRFRDDNEEYKKRLEAMNKELMEKQDYEIHMATLAERTRIAREIHDNVGHMLTRSILQVGALMALSKDTAQKQALSDLKDTLDCAMTNIRQSVHDLHDESLDLYAEINKLITHYDKCHIHYEYNITHDLNRKCKYSILAIIKEALANIMKHSNATNVDIILQEHPALYQVLIHDNGTNIPPIEDNGIGIHNIKDRVENMNGTLHLSTEHGFRIFISIPKNKDQTRNGDQD